MKKEYITYTGGYEYYILLVVGCNKVYRKWERNDGSEPEEMFTGSYKDCVAYIKRVFAENYAYDNDL